MFCKAALAFSEAILSSTATTSLKRLSNEEGIFSLLSSRPGRTKLLRFPSIELEDFHMVHSSIRSRSGFWFWIWALALEKSVKHCFFGGNRWGMSSQISVKRACRALTYRVAAL